MNFRQTLEYIFSKKPQGSVHSMMYRAPKLLYPNGEMSGASRHSKFEKLGLLNSLQFPVFPHIFPVFSPKANKVTDNQWFYRSGEFPVFEDEFSVKNILDFFERIFLLFKTKRIYKIKSPTFVELLTDRGHPSPNIFTAITVMRPTRYFSLWEMTMQK